MYDTLGDNLCGNFVSYLISGACAYIRKYTRDNDADEIIPNLWVGSEKHLKYKFDTTIDLRDIREGGVPTIKQTEGILWGLKYDPSPRKLVFCRMGRSRSAMIAVLYLVDTGMGLEEAIKLVKSKRKYVHFNKLQKDFMRSFVCLY